MSDKFGFDSVKPSPAGTIEVFVGDFFRLGAAAAGLSNHSTASTDHAGFRDRLVSAGADGFDDRRLIRGQSPRHYLSVGLHGHASNSNELPETAWAAMRNQWMNRRARPQIPAESLGLPSLFFWLGSNC